jgi:hypothetical protein
MYKCLKQNFTELQKRIRATTKKLDKYGMEWNFRVIGEGAEKVDVFDIIDNEKIKIGSVVLDVVSYEFTMQQLKVGTHTVEALIEHGTDGNVIHVFGDMEIGAEWWTAKSKCEHCNVNRSRNKTVLLKQNDVVKQVGTTCVHEYTGIDAIEVIGAYASINDIINEEPKGDRSHLGGSDRYMPTLEYLAACVWQIDAHGYKKTEFVNSTADEAWQHGNNLNMAKATEIMEYFKAKEYEASDVFMNNIKNALRAEYTKASGFIAYAYEAYKKEIAKTEKVETVSESKHVGNVGDKITVNVTVKAIITYENHFTYYGGVSYIYIFEDENKNVFKWNSSNGINAREGDKISLKGSIKEHSEYNGVKQTAITRCKVL